MKMSFLVLVFLLSGSTFAGGFDISGNGNSFEALIKQTKANREKIVEINNSCPRKNRDGRPLNLSSFKVIFKDGFDHKPISPIRLTPIGNQTSEGQQKYELVFLMQEENGKISVLKRELFVNERFKNANVLDIVWRTAQEPFKVNKFDKTEFVFDNDECIVKGVLANNSEIQDIIASSTGASSFKPTLNSNGGSR